MLLMVANKSWRIVVKCVYFAQQFTISVVKLATFQKLLGNRTGLGKVWNCWWLRVVTNMVLLMPFLSTSRNREAQRQGD